MDKPKKKLTPAQAHRITRGQAQECIARCESLHPDFRIFISYLIATDNNETRVSYHTQVEMKAILRMGVQTIFRPPKPARQLASSR